MSSLSSVEEIKSRYAQLKAEMPGLRARNAAETLGVSEGELVASRVGDGVVRLIDDPQAILSAAVSLGRVMALTRNDCCVHERHGVYDNPQFFSHGKMSQGLYNNPDIDLRLFMTHWRFCFAVTETSGDVERHSLQFFDKAGGAIHKIYMTGESNPAAYPDLIERFRAPDQSTGIVIETYDAAPTDRDDAEVDWSDFRASWEGLKDTHDFFPMLRKYKIGREQAFRRIGGDFAYRVDNRSARRVLELASENGLDIMVFVGNRGCIQIHSGTVAHLVEHGPWFNVLDPAFNLHLSEPGIARTWVTRKPTVDGNVTAVEVFAENGELIVTFFGKRKPGQPELAGWRELVERLEAIDVEHAA